MKHFIVSLRFSPIGYFVSKFDDGELRLTPEKNEALKMSQDEASLVLNRLENSPTTRGMYSIQEVSK